MLSPRDRRLAEEFKRQLTERGAPFHHIIAFGSRARGDARPDSDLDVLIVTQDEGSGLLDAVEDCAWEVGFAEDVYIQPVIKRLADIEQGPEAVSPFMAAVRSEGVQV